jgi:hypothetical protein
MVKLNELINTEPLKIMNSETGLYVPYITSHIPGPVSTIAYHKEGKQTFKTKSTHGHVARMGR